MKSRPLSLTHLVRPPTHEADGKPPLLVLLHGVGSNEEDLFALAEMMDPRFLVISARAPIMLQPGAYAWYHVTFTPQGPIHTPGEAEKSRQKLVRFLDEAVEAYAADPARVFVMGFSQGGAMTFCLAITAPEKLAGAVVMSGRTIPEMEPLIATPEKFHDLPVMVVHGTRDVVLTIAFGRALKEWFERLPVGLTYREYDMAHEISGRSLADIQDWLEERLG